MDKDELLQDVRISKILDHPGVCTLITASIIVTGCFVTVFMINEHRATALEREKTFLMVLIKHIMINQNLVLMI